MKRHLLFALLVFAFGCRRTAELPPMSLDTLKAAGDTTFKAKDSAQTKTDTAHPNLPPMAKAIDPARLANFLPKLPDWKPEGELQTELQIRENFNRSRVAQTYVNGAKKLKVQIDDFAYVPYLYDPWQKFKGTYLDDDNVQRTESTTIAGYHAVQSMEKHDPHGEVTVLPGNRYVVTIVEDGAENINEVRRIAEGMDLRGLEALQ
jgi:hypothetical protein